MKNLISVIIPFYNVEKHILNTLSSLLAQSTVNFELILVDDFSTDNSYNIVESFLEKQSRIAFRMIKSTKNNGVSVNRNIGLSQALGDYIVFADADDIVEPIYIEELYAPFKDIDIDMSICRYDIQEHLENGVLKVKNGDNSSFLGKVSASTALNALLQDQERSFLWKCMFRKRLFDNIEFPAGCNFLEDAVVLPKLYASARYLYYVGGESLYHYQIRQNSMTTSAVNPDNFVGLSDAIQQTVDYLTKTKIGIDDKYITRYQFLFSYNIIVNILQKKNIEWEKAAPIYKKMEKTLFKSQLINLLKNHNLRSIFWLYRLKFFPKSIWNQH